MPFKDLEGDGEKILVIDDMETQKLGAGKYIKKPLTLETIGIAVKEELEK